MLELLRKILYCLSKLLNINQSFNILLLIFCDNNKDEGNKFTFCLVSSKIFIFF